MSNVNYFILLIPISIIIAFTAGIIYCMTHGIMLKEYMVPFLLAITLSIPTMPFIVGGIISIIKNHNKGIIFILSILIGWILLQSILLIGTYMIPYMIHYKKRLLLPEYIITMIYGLLPFIACFTIDTALTANNLKIYEFIMNTVNSVS